MPTLIVRRTVMEVVSIGDLRGQTLRETARRREPVAITSHRVLIGILIPAARGWIEHLINHNWSHLLQIIAEGEESTTDGQPLVTLDKVIAEAAVAVWGSDNALGSEPQSLAVQLGTQTIDNNETLERLQTTLSSAVSMSGLFVSDEPSVRTARASSLTARAIEQAGADGDVLAVIDDRELIGILIPITRSLVEFLIEQNLSRVMAQIVTDEKPKPDAATEN
jgi:hypothetical protein